MPSPQSRTPRKPPTPATTDPPLPTPLQTKSEKQEESQIKIPPKSSQPSKPLQPAKTLDAIATLANAPNSTGTTANSKKVWATKSTDSPRLKETIRDLQRFLIGLPFPLIKLTPTIVARAICRVMATQGVMPTNVAFDIALLFWRLIINIFFRSIQPRGAWRIPPPNDGPVIFVGAPHHNQFLDPLLLASEVRRGSGRRVAFLTAQKSLNRPFIGAAARLMQSIPVVRAADGAKKGSGTITLHPSGDPLLLQGHNSQFTKELVVKGQIVLPKAAGYASAEVVEIVSDTEVKIKKEFKDSKAIKALKGNLPEGPLDQKEGGKEEGKEGCMYQCLPYVDQTQMYSTVYESLARGGSLGIFPEGGSHDRTDLLPLKAGVVIMALGAMASNPGLQVKIVPVGLSYFHPHKFRSRAVVEFGSPLEVPRELVGLFEKGGEGKREAVGKMMDLVYDGLKSVTVRAPDYETLMFIQAGRRLYTPTGAHPTLSQVVHLNRQFIIGYSKHKDEPRVQKLKEDILRYNKMLIYAGLRDHQVERATRAGWRSLGLLGYRLFLLGLWGGLALPGVVLNSPIILLAKIISRRKAKEALLASQVKVAGRDVVATWKVLVSLGITPVLYALYAGVATYLAHKHGLRTRHQLFMPLYTMTAMPMLAYSTVKFSEVGLDIYKSLPPLFVSLMPGNYKVIKELQETRVRIAADLHQVIEELGPQTFSDFDEKRLFSQRPSSSAPPPPGTPGREGSFIWKEKATPADSNSSSYLSHPLSWADERLFGWSAHKSSSKTRARTGSTSDSSATLVEPSSVKEGIAREAQEADEEEEEEDEEEEEEGDYEAIFSMINPARLCSQGGDGVKSPRSPKHSRSRSGSTAGESFRDKRNRSSSDLKAFSLATQPLSPTLSRSTALNGNEKGINQRRTRTHSLSEDVRTKDIQDGGKKDGIYERPFDEAGRTLEQKASERRGGDQGQYKPALNEMKPAESTPSKPGTPTEAA